MKQFIATQAAVDHLRSRVPGESTSPDQPRGAPDPSKQWAGNNCPLSPLPRRAADCGGEETGEGPEKNVSYFPAIAKPWSSIVIRVIGLTTAVLVPCAVLANILCRTQESTQMWWLSESGPVELASGWGYVLLAAGLLTVGVLRLGKAQMGREHSTIRDTAIWYPMLLGSCVAALAAREFDWHNIWTTQGVLKTSFYIDPAISIKEKIAAVAALCLIGFFLVSVIRAHGSTFLVQLRRGQTAALLAATGIMLLPVSKALDSGPRIFARFFPADPTYTRRFLGSVEEIMELAIPLLFLMAAIVTIWSSRRNGNAGDIPEQEEAVYSSRRAA